MYPLGRIVHGAEAEVENREAGIPVDYRQIDPVRLLLDGADASHVNDTPWLVRWDLLGANDFEAVLDEVLPAVVEVWTSGSTGPRRRWHHTREQLWNEAGLLAEILAAGRPDAVLSFAPPRHLYGLLGSVLVPARLRVPAWYRPQFFGAMPEAPAMRWAVVAVPWTFSILARHEKWALDADHLAILHSTAMLPRQAELFLDRVGRARASLTEVFGSTETGGVAWRRHHTGDDTWTLFSDVSFTEPDTAGGHEEPLAVTSPRLACEPGRGAPSGWRMDDFVRRVDARSFRFSGRRGSLVKINGRRFNLDELDRVLQAHVPCADIACVPVTHPVSGEHIDILVVEEPGRERADVQAAILASGLGVQPREVRFVDRIERTDSGKPRRGRAPALLAEEQPRDH